MDCFKNKPEIINNGLAALRNAISDAQLPVKVEAAAEYMLDEGFVKKFHAGELLTFGKSIYLLNCLRTLLLKIYSMCFSI